MIKKIEVRRVELWTLFKVAFFLYAAIGLVSGLFYSFFLFVFGGLGGLMEEEVPEMPALGLLTGVVGLFIAPVLAFVYGALGSVVVTIGGAIFNLISRVVGGIRFEIGTHDVAPPLPPTASTPPQSPRPSVSAPPAPRAPEPPPASPPAGPGPEST